MAIENNFISVMKIRQVNEINLLSFCFSAPRMYACFFPLCGTFRSMTFHYHWQCWRRGESGPWTGTGNESIEANGTSVANGPNQANCTQWSEWSCPTFAKWQKRTLSSCASFPQCIGRVLCILSIKAVICVVFDAFPLSHIMQNIDDMAILCS